MLRIRSSVALLLLCFSLPAVAQTPPSGTGQSVLDEARERFRRGVELYHEGDYRAALIEFDRANKLAPNFRIHFNIAQAYLELQNYTDALSSFERYLSEGGDQLSAADKTNAAGEIRKLAGRIAGVQIAVNAPKSTVFIDDVSIGSPPFDKPLRLSAGRRKIVVTSDGYLPQTKIVDLAGGDSLQLQFVLELVAKTPAGQPVVVPEAPKLVATPMGTGFWVSLATTSVLAVGAGATGYLAIDAKNKNNDELNTLGVSRSSLESSDRHMRNYALATDVLLGATAVAAGLTVYFAVTRSSEPTRVGLVPGGAVVTGNF